MTTVHSKLNELIGPVVESLECELWGIEYLTQGRGATLRIFIDKEDGIGVAECEKVSRQVSSILDVEDPIASHYILEVSSPGMDRPLFSLNQFERSIGSTVAVKLSRKFEDRKKLTGVIVGIEDDEVVLRIEDEEYLLPFELIEKANIVPIFD